jgi:hypothetical protein
MCFMMLFFFCTKESELTHSSPHSKTRLKLSSPEISQLIITLLRVNHPRVHIFQSKHERKKHDDVH